MLDTACRLSPTRCFGRRSRRRDRTESSGDEPIAA
jgi:hypothetical protein